MEDNSNKDPNRGKLTYFKEIKFIEPNSMGLRKGQK